MCKKIFDILFPLNILGKDRRCVDYKLSGLISDTVINVEWTGDRLEIAYTQLLRLAMPPQVNPVKEVYTNGDSSIISVDTRPRPQTTQLVENVVYFNCTNVTKLIVNGEQLI